jgi:hypothetical protein
MPKERGLLTAGSVAEWSSTLRGEWKTMAWALPAAYAERRRRPLMR